MANLSTLLGGGGLQSKPVLHVQDVKDGNIGGGYIDSANTPYTRDINRIVKNSISGATLTNDGTTSGSVGAVGTQGIVNNQSGVHVNSTYVTLPAGDYYYELSAYYEGSGGVTVDFLYDKTAAADLSYARIATGAAGSSAEVLTGFFSLSTSSNVDVRVANASTVTSSAGLGSNSFGSSIKVKHLDLKIYKL